MKFNPRIAFSLFILIFAFNNTFSAGEVCCYNPGSDTNIQFRTNSCSSGEIEVGPADFLGRTFCEDYENTRLGCSNGNSCSALVNGNRIYDIESVLTSISVNITNLCDGGTQAYDELTCNGNSQIDTETETDSTITNPGGGSGSRLNNADDTIENTRPDTGVNSFCKDAGEPFGFFASKSRCEAIEGCLYNPYRGGHFSNKFVNVDVFNFSAFEAKCVPKNQIFECHDYKTADNCFENPAKEFSPTGNLDRGCGWISGSQYAYEEGLPGKKGICISKGGSKGYPPYGDEEEPYYEFPSTYLNNFAYSFRGNLLKNPSFEGNFADDEYSFPDNWHADLEIYNDYYPRKVEYPEEEYSYHGKTSVTLHSNEYDFEGEIYDFGSDLIYQEVLFTAENVAYVPSMYVKLRNSYYGEPKVILSLIAKDVSGEEITRRDTTIAIDEDSEGYFQRVVFPTFIIPKDTNSVDFIATVSRGSFEFDAISFEPLSETNLDAEDPIFKPLELISSAASYCHLCHDELEFNYCTQTKSNWMGDCSYMVPDVSQPYFSEAPWFANYFESTTADIEDFKWRAQSMPGAEVSCSLYVTPETCTNPENYINEKYKFLHGLSEDRPSLCTWSGGFCVKDSNGDNKADTSNGVALLRWSSPSSTYTYEGDNSDFALACDSLPPNAYVYFNARNNSGGPISLAGSEVDLIGAAEINLELSDALVESCARFAINPRLYVDYRVNGITYHIYYDTNQQNLQMPIQELFIDGETGETLIVDGPNDISIQIKDQSGNVARDLTYSLNLDVNGPEIILPSEYTFTSPGDGVFVLDQFLSANTIMDLRITDSSDIKSCSYVLEPYTTETIEDSYYSPTGDFDLSAVSDLKNFQYEFELPIFNSSQNGDTYNFILACYDVFDQLGIEQFYINVDMRTDIVILSPKPFVSLELDYGFIGGPTVFRALSTETTLDSCVMSFDGGPENSLLLETPTTGDYFNVSKYPYVPFTYNITGQLDFADVGIHDGYIKCYDGVGNEFEQDLRYYYDSSVPVVADYELIGSNISNRLSVIEYEDKYYTIYNRPGYFNLTLDGVGSWIKNSFDWKYGDVIVQSANFDLSLDNESYVSNLKISNFDNLVGLLYEGEHLGNGLYEITHDLDFSNKINPSSEGITYYLDKSIPKFVFTGDIENEVDDILYTKVVDPFIEISFNVPDYRSFTCSVEASAGNLKFTKELDSDSSYGFKLSDISVALNLNNYENIKLDFDCVDVYGKTLKDFFTLRYDNQVPILNDAYLSGGENKFFQNLPGLTYGDVLDSIIYEFEDTNEDGYFCKYSVHAQEDFYICNSSWFSHSFPGSGSPRAINPAFNLISGDAGALEKICSRNTDLFGAEQLRTYNSNLQFQTNLKIHTFCTDRVGLETQNISFDVSIDYVNSTNLFGFEFIYDDIGLRPVVRAFENYGDVFISLSPNGDDALMRLFNPEFDGNVYTYTGDYINEDDFVEANNILWAVVLDNAGNVLHRISANLFVDRVAPNAIISIPDEVNGEVYSNEFEVLMSGIDPIGEIDNMELYINGRLVYNVKDLSHNNRSIHEPLVSENYCNENICNGRVIFHDGAENETYNFNLRVYDKFGNLNQSSITLRIVDGVGIKLLGTSSAVVDPSKLQWATNAIAPTIKFETSKLSDVCRVRPMVDGEWQDITGNQNIHTESASSISNTVHEFDLSTFPGLDLSKLSDGVNPISIACLYEGKYYNYTRNLRYVDTLPDYVLISERGFAINDAPYDFLISVKSVGAYPYISCSYRLDNAPTIDFQQQNTTFMTGRLELEGLSNGEHTLELVCEDIVGNVGPSKEYIFTLNKGTNLEVSDIQLSDGVNIFIPENDQLYVSAEKSLELTFKLDKENSQCTYIIESGGILSGFVNLFNNIFGTGNKDISVTSNPFEFRASGLEFSESGGTLVIDCNHPEGGSLEREYVVNIDDTEFSINATRVGIN